MNRFFIGLAILLHVEGASSNSEQDLVNKLLNFTDYNTRVRPVLDEKKPVVVKHGIVLTELSEINEKQQKMIVNVLQMIEWKDELLNWNPANYGGIKEINMDASHFWLPRLLLYNNADEKYAIERDDAQKRIILKYDGNITWIVPGILKSSCKINVKYFPLDHQFCTLKIGSWTYGVDKQDIYPIMDHIDLSMYSTNGQWKLLETWAHRQTLRHSCCSEEVALISYDIHIERLTLFYITNFLLPCALIAALTAMVFLTPAETGEQLAVGVTILLSLVVFFLMVETRVPNTSDHLPLIAKYYCCTVIEISAVLALTCVIHKFEHHAAVPLPAWVKKYIIGYMGKAVFMKFANDEINGKDATKSENSGQENDDDKSEKTVPRKKSMWMKKEAFLSIKKDPSPFEGNKDVQVISKSMKEDYESEKLEMQWKHAANILTRFMAVVYIFVITITFFATILGRQDHDNVFPKKQ